MCRDIEHLTRVTVSYRYIQLKKNFQETKKIVDDLGINLTNNEQKIKENCSEANKIEVEMNNLQMQLKNQDSVIHAEFEAQLESLSKKDSVFSARRSNLMEEILCDERKLEQLNCCILNEKSLLETKEKEIESIISCYNCKKLEHETNKVSLDKAQTKFEALSTGNSEGNVSLNHPDEVQTSDSLSKTVSLLKKKEIELDHKVKVLRNKEGESVAKDNAYLKENQLIEILEKEVEQLNSKLLNFNYREDSLEEIKAQQIEVKNKLQKLEYDYEKQGGYKFDFNYTNPEPNFDQSRVLGRICSLVKVKNNENSLALSTIAGGNLFSVVTDTEQTGKLILQKGNLQTRVTIIPLNKVTCHPIDSNCIKIAKEVAGHDQVWHALALIEFDSKLIPAINFVFGSAFVCKNLDIAKKIAFHPQIRRKCVTIEGDVVNPDGTLSGGSVSKESSIFSEMNAIKDIKRKIIQLQNTAGEINLKNQKLLSLSHEYRITKEKLSLKTMELQAAKSRLAISTFSAHQNEIKELKKSIGNLNYCFTCHSQWLC